MNRTVERGSAATPNGRARWVVLVVILVVLAGCGADKSGSKKDSSRPDEDRHELVSTYASNGGTMTVVVGDRIRVVLEGPSWTFLPTSNEKVVKQDGKTEVVKASDSCGSGGECGYATAYFDVLEAGKAEIRASRADCAGAEEGCTTGDGAYKLTISAPKS